MYLVLFYFQPTSVLEFEVRLFINSKCFVNILPISLHACCSQTIYMRAIIDMSGIKSAILLYAVCLFPRIPLFLFFGGSSCGLLEHCLGFHCDQLIMFKSISLCIDFRVVALDIKHTRMSYQSLLISTFYRFQ